MLGIDTRAARATWTAALTILLLYLIYLARKPIFVFVVALLFAYLLSPLVRLIDRILPARSTRTLALALAYLLFLGVATFAGTEIGSRAVEEASALGKRLPAMLASWQQPNFGAPEQQNQLKTEVAQKIQSLLNSTANEVLAEAPRAGIQFLSVASNVIYVVVVPILAFFFLKDGDALLEATLDLVDAGPRRELLGEFLADAHLLLAQYIRALVGLSAAAFAAYALFFSLAGVPYAMLLAALGGMLEFIPLMGSLTAAAVILTVAAIAGSHLLAVAIFLAVFRIFQDYVLSPMLMSQGVELHPLVVLFGVYTGAEIAGVAGAFLSVPVMALGRVLYRRVQKAHQD